MRASRFFFPTLREAPADAEMVGHALLARGAFIRRVAAGIYSYLPLGWRVLYRIEQIVRKEMNRAGAIEILMPVVSPAELWKESGRYESYVPPLAKWKDMAGREFVLGPTHEEVVTDIVRHSIHSYKQLPLNLYQIQTKFRDELRPRGGLIRGREFVMKDAYSFDSDKSGLDESFSKMHEAYCRIFDRCGLAYVVVEAEGGSIGGTDTNEFMVPSESGEDTMMRCERCGYGANREKAEIRPAENKPADAHLEPLRKVPTPGMKTVEQVTAFLDLPSERLVKTLLILADDQVVAALIRGDRELNELKLQRALGAKRLEMADAATVERITSAPVGFAGPVSLKGIRIIADHEVQALYNFVTGANEDDAHYVNVNVGRDFKIDQAADIRLAVKGDRCPRCEGTYRDERCIEVGHIFKLGTIYTSALGATFQNERGELQPLIMGCYGIGVSRILAAVAEVSHDEKGLIWPPSIAPFDVSLLLLDVEDPELRSAADNIEQKLEQAGYDVLYDERAERAGVKFADADLIGIPFQIVVGKRTKETGQVEVRKRKDRAQVMANLDDVIHTLESMSH